MPLKATGQVRRVMEALQRDAADPAKVAKHMDELRAATESVDKEADENAARAADEASQKAQASSGGGGGGGGGKDAGGGSSDAMEATRMALMDLKDKNSQKTGGRNPAGMSEDEKTAVNEGRPMRGTAGSGSPVQERDVFEMRQMARLAEAPFSDGELQALMDPAYAGGGDTDWLNPKPAKSPLEVAAETPQLTLSRARRI